MFISLTLIKCDTFWDPQKTESMTVAKASELLSFGHLGRETWMQKRFKKNGVQGD